MSKSDQSVIFILIVFILIYIAVWITGAVKHSLAFYCCFLNALTGIILIGYWVWNQLNITQHSFEMREIVVLGIEALIVGVSIYSILHHPFAQWLRVLQYIIYGANLLILIAFLVFMMTFKITKLF